MSRPPYPWPCDADGCANKKGENNHWFVVWVDHAGPKPRVVISGWDDQLAENDSVFRTCGEFCLHKLVTKLTQQIAPGGGK